MEKIVLSTIVEAFGYFKKQETKENMQCSKMPTHFGAGGEKEWTKKEQKLKNFSNDSSLLDYLFLIWIGALPISTNGKSLLRLFQKC